MHCNDGTAIIPSELEEAIPSGSEYHSAWVKFMNSARLDLQKIFQCPTTHISGVLPDYTDDPPVPIKHVVLEEVSFDENDGGFWKAKATRDLPDIILTEDMQILLCVKEAINGHGTMTLRQCELFGYGLGDFAVVEHTPETGLKLF